MDERPSVAGEVRLRVRTAAGGEVLLFEKELTELLASDWWSSGGEGTDPVAAARPTIEQVREALNRSRALVFENPGEAEVQSRLGRSLAGGLDPRRYGGAAVRDQQALAEACLANVLRVAGDLERARSHMVRARQCLALGRLGSEEGVTVRELEVSLWRDLHDFGAALEISEGVIDDHRTAGRRSAVASALLTRASLLEVMGEPERALSCLREAVRETPAADAELSLWTAHNLAFALARAGRTGEASELFERWRPHYRSSAGVFQPAVLARRDWLGGLLAEEPVALLASARRRFRSAGFAFDAALVSLDLMLALSAAGRQREAMSLARETYRELAARGVERDALAALLQFQHAAREAPEVLLPRWQRAVEGLRRVLADRRAASR